MICHSGFILFIFGGYFGIRFYFEIFQEVLTISKENKVNGEITDKKVRLIDKDGNMLGIVDIDEALRVAEDSKLDLVNVSPNANPPVCKVLDYGKFRYEAQKKEKMAKKKQKTIQVKEIRLSTFIEEHDVHVKADKAMKFLKNGDKVKVSLRFRGRERDNTAQGKKVMEQFAELCSEYGHMDKKPAFEGRSLTMFLLPKSNKDK